MLGDPLVEHRAQQERRDHAEARGEQDQEEHPGQAPAIGREETQDAVRVALPTRVEQRRWRLLEKSGTSGWSPR